MNLSLQITDISNDTFIWGPWINGFIKAPKLQVLYHDLEKINQDLLSGKGADICKVSFQILPEISNEYILLSVGSTIVDGLTPKIVSKKQFVARLYRELKKDLKAVEQENVGISDDEALPINVLPFPGEP